MCLVDDDGVVTAQQLVSLQFSQQDAVGHHFYERVGTCLVGETHLVPDSRAKRRAQLGRDTFGHRACRDAPGLRVADRAQNPAPELEADLRQLRRLARARLPRDDHDLMVANRLGDLVFALDDRQPGRITDERHQATPARKLPFSDFKVGGDGIERGVELRPSQPSRAVEAPT